MSLFAAAALLVATLPAEKPPAGTSSRVDPCAQEGTQMEMTDCAQQRYQKADARLNRAYKPLLEGLDQEHQVKLKAAEKAWIAFRDAECDLEASEALHGSMEGQILFLCLEAATETRIKELAALRESLKDYVTETAPPKH